MVDEMTTSIFSNYWHLSCCGQFCSFYGLSLVFYS